MIDLRLGDEKHRKLSLLNLLFSTSFEEFINPFITIYIYMMDC